MEKEFLRARLETEQERCLGALTELTPGSEEYDRCLWSAQRLNNWLRYGFESPERSSSFDAPAPAVAEPEEPAPVPAEPTMKKEDVRAALADARMKGVDISKLIADMGAANLTAVDPADYPKLMAALAKELEDK